MNSAPVPSTICPGTAITLTATGAPAGSTYTFRDVSGIIQTNTTGVLNVTPTTSTSYTVTTNVPTCGTGTVTQNIQINTSLSIASNDADDIFTPGQQITLTASGGTVGSYQWSQTVNGVTTPIAGNGATQTVSPVTFTTYTVTSTNSNNCGPASRDLRPFGVLPVSLSHFEAVRAKTGVQLRWTTASEQNNAYFEVQRSTNGETFAEVARVTGAGTTTRRTDYQFLDSKLPVSASGLLYYRLRQVDSDGTTAYSPIEVVQVASSKLQLGVEVFPNPYDKHLRAQFQSQSEGIVSWEVHDAVGRPKLSGTAVVGVGKQELNLAPAATLSAGVYYLVIKQGVHQQTLKINHR